MNKIILSILFIIFICGLGKGIDIVYSDPTDFTNLNIECNNNDHIIFDNDQLTFSNTSFSMDGKCTITSNVGLIDFKITSVSTSSLQINLLVLEEIKFTINSNSTLNDFQSKISDLSSLNINSNVLLSYSELTIENTDIISGGLITIQNGYKLELRSSIQVTYTISSNITNYSKLEVNLIRLGVNINKFIANELSFNYFNDGVFSTVENGRFEFYDCTIQIGIYCDLKGGVLSISFTDFYTRNLIQYSYFYNTTLEFSNNSTLTLYRYNEDNVGTNLNIAITALRLKSGSKVVFINGTSSLIYRLFSMSVYYIAASTETFIHNDEGTSDCGGYYQNTNTIECKSSVGSGILRLSGKVMCSNRNQAALLYITNALSISLDINGCPPDEYACKGSVQCLKINETCLAGTQCSDSSPSQLRDNYDYDLLSSDPSGLLPRCWDGECALYGYSKCTPYPPCPAENPLRCSGNCVAVGQTCTSEILCVTKCPDGCYNETRECQPFNGCPLYHFQCPNNDCVQDYSLCSNETTNLPFSDRFVSNRAVIYANTRDTATLVRKSNYSHFLPTADITLNYSSTNTNVPINIIEIQPISDSHGFSISGSKIYSGFNYYTDLLSAPFRIKINSENSTTFEQPAEFYFETPHTDLPICLAFENNKGEWECTPYKPVVSDDKIGVFVKTSHFTNFALIVTYREDSSSSGESSGIFSDKKTLAIAVSLSVVGAVVLVVAVGLLINFKLKYTSLRRWRVSRDLEREQSRSRLTTASSTSSSSSTGADLI